MRASIDLRGAVAASLLAAAFGALASPPTYAADAKQVAAPACESNELTLAQIKELRDKGVALQAALVEVSSKTTVSSSLSGELKGCACCAVSGLDCIAKAITNAICQVGASERALAEHLAPGEPLTIEAKTDYRWERQRLERRLEASNCDLAEERRALCESRDFICEYSKILAAVPLPSKGADAVWANSVEMLLTKNREIACRYITRCEERGKPLPTIVDSK